MPHITKRYRSEKIVVWKKSDQDYDNYGNPLVQAPEEIEVRWENVDREVRSVDGSVIACDALVYVKTPIPTQSIFWRGALADLPVAPTGLMLVQEYNETPSLTGKNMDRYCFMLAYGDKLPGIASSGSGT